MTLAQGTFLSLGLHHSIDTSIAHDVIIDAWSGRSSGVRWDAMVGLAVLGQDRVRVGDGPVQSHTIGLHVLTVHPAPSGAI